MDRCIKNSIILVSLITIICIVASINYGIKNQEIDEGNSTHEFLSEEMSKEILNIDLNLLEQGYIDLDNEEDIQLIKNIMESTSLDFQASFVIVSYARKFDIKPSLITAVIELESNYDKYCVGTHKDRGYMQIIPETEKWLVEEFGDELGIVYNPDKIFEPEYNIGLGVSYISLLKKAYGNDYNRILSEYNRGPYNLSAYYKKYKTYETGYSRNILNIEKKYEIFNE